MTSAPRPVLGIACCTRTVGTEPAQAVMNRYVVHALRYADVAGLLVPALPELMSGREVAPRLDGLLLTGSPSNIEPGRYGQADAPDAEGPYDPGRDTMTADLIAAMLDLGKPVFGICRGLQEVNVAFGGALRRDASRADELIAHHAPDEAAFEAMFDHHHDVALSPGGVLSRGLGRASLTRQLGALPGHRYAGRRPDRRGHRARWRRRGRFGAGRRRPGARRAMAS